MLCSYSIPAISAFVTTSLKKYWVGNPENTTHAQTALKLMVFNWPQWTLNALCYFWLVHIIRALQSAYQFDSLHLGSWSISTRSSFLPCPKQGDEEPMYFWHIASISIQYLLWMFLPLPKKVPCAPWKITSDICYRNKKSVEITILL